MYCENNNTELLKVAAAQAKRFPQDASATFAKLFEIANSDSWSRNTHLGEIAETMAKADLEADALEVIKKIPPSDASAALREVASGQARAGRYRTAFETVKKINNDVDRMMAITTVERIRSEHKPH